MKISKVKIKNFRLLKNLDLRLEDHLSLVIGKNNTGKTSLLSLLEKFLNEKKNTREFACDDFNLDFQKKLKAIVEGKEVVDEFLGISLKIFIEYGDRDDLSNLRQVMMDLNPDNRTAVISFEYCLNSESLEKLKTDYLEFEGAEKIKIDGKPTPQNVTAKEEENIVRNREEKKNTIFYEFLKKNHTQYFKVYKRALLFDVQKASEDENSSVDLLKENIQIDRILNFKVIHANRDMTNRRNDKTLSDLSSKYYEKKEAIQNDLPAIRQFKEILTETDDNLDKVYDGLFRTVIDKVEKFGGLHEGDSMIKVISSLQHKELLKGNTTVMYDHDENHSLPEHYNGLGYMNLIGIIFEVELLLSDFRKEYSENEQPSDINLLFIEEPEAHTHPQMQYIFINNVKEILLNASRGDNGLHRPFTLQSIISTHSPHIVADSQFDDIKYFKREHKNEVVAKSLQELEKEYASDGSSSYFKFLKQYLTLNRAELFFAEKAIFIEGDTERILLPAMMKKIDSENPENPLLSQNISVVEVGNYFQVFEKFINFIGIKSLVITDIDSAKEVEKEFKGGAKRKVPEKCRVADATTTTNASLKYFFGDKKELSFYKNLKDAEKVLLKDNGKWKINKDGVLSIIFQRSEKDASGVEYHARSFEDAFFHLNKKFVADNQEKFTSLKNRELFENGTDAYDLADQCVESKPSFAIDILINSETDAGGRAYSNWSIPAYIKDGLEWLKKN